MKKEMHIQMQKTEMRIEMQIEGQRDMQIER